METDQNDVTTSQEDAESCQQPLEGKEKAWNRFLLGILRGTHPACTLVSGLEPPKL